AGNSFVYDPNPNSFNDPPNFFNHPPQPQTYSCELCGNDSHYGYDCPPRVPLVYEQEPCYNQNFGDNYYPQNSPSFPQQYLCCENYGGPHESFQCQSMNQNYFEPNPSYSGFDQPSQYPIDQSPPQEISIQDMEDLKQQYLDEMKSMINKIQIKDYRNERIDIRYRRECEIKIDKLKESVIPLRDIISELPPSVAITPDLSITDSLIIWDENLSTFPEKESDEFIKSSVEDHVPIPRESEDTFENDSECDLPFSDNPMTFSNPLFDSNDDFTSSDDESLPEEDVPEENFKIHSNPLFEFDNTYISSDVNPLSDEVLENIESKDSYVSNFDEPALLVTPLSNANEDECFDPGGDVDEIELLLHRDPSTPKISVASILEGFTDEPPLEKNDDLFDLESKENEWKKILYDAPIDELMAEDKDLTPGFHRIFFLQHM
ncbi:hypothetical protein Tco_1195551, partial [Tanacetum coccineum]